MKQMKLVIGILLVLVALWVIITEQMAAASADATINARLVTLRAPVAGSFNLRDRELGSEIKMGEALGSISDPIVDNVHLNDLIMEQSLASATLAHDKAALDSTQSAIAQMTARLASYQQGRLTDLRLQLAHATHRVALLRRDTPATTAAAPAKAVLPAKTGDSAAEGQNSAAAIPVPTAPTIALDQAEERVQELRNDIALAEKGVYIGDSYNDAPYSEQSLTQLQSSAEQLQNQIAQDQSRIDIVTTRVKREQVRVNALRGGEIDSPVNGLFWEELASDNEDVQRGDPLLRLVNCDSVVVTASVPETTYDRLSRGQSVDFRPLGQDKSFSGTIVRLAGAGARTIYTNLAVAPSEKHLQRYDVTIALPGLKSDPDFACAIGRTGRVFFDSRPLDWLRRLGL